MEFWKNADADCCRRSSSFTCFCCFSLKVVAAKPKQEKSSGRERQSLESLDHPRVNVLGFVCMVIKSELFGMFTLYLIYVDFRTRWLTIQKCFEKIISPFFCIQGSFKIFLSVELRFIEKTVTERSRTETVTMTSNGGSGVAFFRFQFPDAPSFYLDFYSIYRLPRSTNKAAIFEETFALKKP